MGSDSPLRWTGSGARLGTEQGPPLAPQALLGPERGPPQSLRLGTPLRTPLGPRPLLGPMLEARPPLDLVSSQGPRPLLGMELGPPPGLGPRLAPPPGPGLELEPLPGPLGDAHHCCIPKSPRNTVLSQGPRVEGHITHTKPHVHQVPHLSHLEMSSLGSLQEDKTKGKCQALFSCKGDEQTRKDRPPGTPGLGWPDLCGPRTKKCIFRRW